MSTPTTCWLRLRPTPPQRQMLQAWFAAAIWAYNETLRGICEGALPVNEVSCLSVAIDPVGQRLHGAVPDGTLFHAGREAVADVLHKRSVVPVLPRDNDDRIWSCPVPRDAVARILPVPAPGRKRARAHLFLASVGPVVAQGPTHMVERLVSDGGLRQNAKLLLHRRRGGVLYLAVRMPDMATPNPRGRCFNRPGSTQKTNEHEPTARRERTKTSMGSVRCTVDGRVSREAGGVLRMNAT